MSAYDSFGFPPGYFVLRCEGVGGRVLDVHGSPEGEKWDDGAHIGLWTEKEQSLVDVRRNPAADNQVFFIDESGALCSRLTGHAIDVTEGDAQGSLVIRHRLPAAFTAGRPLPRFQMDPLTGEITVHFTSGSESSGHSAKKYVLTAIPKAQPRSLLSNASEFLTSTVSAPFSGIFGGGGHTQSTPQAVAEADIDIQEYEVLHEERGEEAEVDDSTDYGRDVRVIQVQIIDDHNLLEKTKLRRRWRALQLRSSDARTGAI